MADFKKLSSVETINEVTDNMSLLIENNGNINRVSKDVLIKPADWETLENKPFDVEKKIILLTEGVSSEDGVYYNVGISDIGFESDLKYTFIIDNIEYSGTAYFDDTDVSMCVPLIRESDGYTVAWVYQQSNYISMDSDVFDINVPHKIEYLEKTYRCVEDQLISNNIPRVVGPAYVGKVLTPSKFDENNAPTEWYMQSPAQSRMVGSFNGNGTQSELKIYKDNYNHSFVHTEPSHAFVRISTRAVIGKSFKIQFNGNDNLTINSSVANVTYNNFYIECVFTGAFAKICIYEGASSDRYLPKGTLKQEFVYPYSSYLSSIKVSLSDGSVIPSEVYIEAYVY